MPAVRRPAGLDVRAPKRGGVTDAGDLGRIAAEFMESIESEYPGATLGVVAVVAEIDIPPGPENDGNGATEITYRCNDGRRWIQGALFDRASRAVDE